MPEDSSTSHPPGDQYQHYIPRFILRYFQDAQIRPKSKKERQKNFHKARRTGVDNDTIRMYDIPSQTFESRPIAKVYGVVNMYRDKSNPKNVDHLEQGLSRLENDSARTIQRIHLAVEAGLTKIQMKRRELEVIRKFTYIMHYRRASLVGTYFDESDPDNRPLKDYMKSFCQKHNLQDKDDYWLFGLKYILETPHHEIVAIGEAIEEKYGGPQEMLKMLRTRVNPDIENFHAVDYRSMAHSCFLGIWEAAEGEEFIVGSNSFGLWDGVFAGIPSLHRLFVVSPKIALVLRPTVVLEYQAANVNVYVTSTLFDIPMTIASSTYANFTSRGWTNAEEQKAAEQALWNYRRTPAAQEDVFTFQPTRLTPDQTHALNSILLLHLPVDGNLTFASPVAMKKTLQYHLRSTIPYSKESKHFLRSLLGALAESSIGFDLAPSTSVPPPKSGIDLVLHSIASGAIEFPSAYDGAYRVYHIASDDLAKYNASSSDIHKMTARAIIKMKEILPPLPYAHRHIYFPFLSRNIVKQLPKEESELFFALVGYQVDLLNVGPLEGGVMGRIKYEAAIIGFTHWLAESRPQVLVELLSFWVKVVL